MKGKVYLAGPIGGLTYGACTDWRKFAKNRLAEQDILGLSPMRGKEYLEAIAKDKPFTCDGDAYAIQGPLSTNRGITTRDRWDATRCDVLLANFAGCKQASVGTAMEIAWADAHRIPVVAVIEQSDPYHNHGIILECVGYRLFKLEQALEVIVAMLA